ncbi:7186_t:CDS:2 [Ambispora gerdemannii]|uniref:7186_t:CDS:1 n=1 Tax=Ambispora gerdemannii TaxID=144530 RepID=A0A9N9FTY4_9GLOM|nr:7186_t:CDS:2 [Ambispora gerdemannii]
MAFKQQTLTPSKNLESNNHNIRASYPPTRRTFRNLKNSTNCKSCDQNYQYVNSLEARLRDLDLIVDKLNGVKVTTESLEKEKLDFSNLDIDELLNISQSLRL